jgi:prepilin-type N-terminal cleavage/methylation domain-containing protein
MSTRLIHKDQRGFTLIEMLVVVVLIGLIGTGITASIIQVLKISTRASNHMVAVRQVQQAGKEVSKDTLQAQNVTCGGDYGFPLILIWTDWDGNNNVVTYNRDITDRTLQRTHTINDEPQATALPIVAEYIDPDPTKTSCDYAGGVLTFTVTAAVGTESETRIYKIEPRPGS